MNWVDILLGIILAIGFYDGFKKGLFVALATLIGLVAGVYGALYFSDFAGSYISNWFDWDAEYAQLAAFALTFIGIIFLFSLGGKALTNIADFAMIGIFNKLLGAVFNTITCAFILSVIFMFIAASTRFSGYAISEEKKAGSMLYAPIASLAPMVLPYILKEVDRYESTRDESDEDLK